MQFYSSDIFFLFVLFLLFFLALFLFTSDKGKKISNILIGYFFLAIFLNLLDSFLLLKQAYMAYPSLALWGSNLILVCGPLIFLYAQSILYKDFQFRIKSMLHFLPFLLLFAVSEISYLIADKQKQMEILTSITDRNIPGSFYFISIFMYVHFIYYLVAALQLLNRYRKAAANQYSNAQTASLGWLQTTIYFFLIIILISALNSYFSFQLLKSTYFFIFSLIIFLFFLFIMISLFTALRNPQIFSAWNEDEIEEALAKPVKYAASQLKEEEKKQILDKLVLHMQQAKPFLEPELVLDDLALQIEVKPKILSQVINEILNQNFFEFINIYRINEAKRLLTNPIDKKITVLEVMYEVGFNSKSSFNTLFKKYTGITPSEFKSKNS